MSDAPDPAETHRRKVDAIGRLAGGIAHDLNNLLTSIRGLSSLALMELEADHPLRTDLEQIEIASQRAAELTRRLSALSPRQSRKTETLDLNAIVRGFEPILRRVLENGTAVPIDYAADLPPVQADAGTLQQFLLAVSVLLQDTAPDAPLVIETGTVPPIRTAAPDAGAGVAPSGAAYAMLRVTGGGEPSAGAAAAALGRFLADPAAGLASGPQPAIAGNGSYLHLEHGPGDTLSAALLLPPAAEAM